MRLSPHPARAFETPLAGRGPTAVLLAVSPLRYPSGADARFSFLSTICGVPVRCLVGGRTSNYLRCFHLPASSVGWPNSLVDKDQTEVCSLSCRVMLLALNPYPPHYRATFASSVLPCPQPRRLPLRFAFLSFSKGRLRVYHVSHLNPDGLGPAYSPVALRLRQERFELLLLSTHHFGTSLYNSTFGLSLVTTFIGGLHLLAMPSNPSPRPPWCWQSSSRLAT